MFSQFQNAAHLWNKYRRLRSQQLYMSLDSWLYDVRHHETPNLISPKLTYVCCFFNAHVGSDRKNIVFIVNDNGELLGGCGIQWKNATDYHELHLYGFGIKDEFQNQGYGQLVLQSIIDYAKLQPKMYALTLDVFKNNHRAKHVYSKHGFRFHAELSENVIRMIYYVEAK